MRQNKEAAKRLQQLVNEVFGWGNTPEEAIVAALVRLQVTLDDIRAYHQQVATEHTRLTVTMERQTQIMEIIYAEALEK